MSQRKKRSKVWDYFEYSTDGNKVKCKQEGCGRLYSYSKTSKGSTGTMKAHLLNQHNIDLKESEDDGSQKSSSSQSARQTSMDGFIKSEKDSLQVCISKLASVEGFSLNKIKTSEFIQKAVAAEGHTLPKSENTLRKMVINDCTEKKSEMKDTFDRKLKCGERFSITLDEWTSIRNRRYININVHDSNNQQFNLGLIRAKGSITSERTLELVRAKCNSFGLAVTAPNTGSGSRDIVSATTDGASVMMRFGRIMGEEHVTCYAHALHLAVQDVFYSKSTTAAATEGEESDNADTLDTTGQEDDTDIEVEVEYSDNEDDEDGYDDDNDVRELNDSVKTIITRVRKVVKQVRKSPLKNDKLQEYVKKEFGKELVVICDNKTRWNTMANMIKRFLKLRTCLQKLSVDFKVIKMNFSENEISSLQNLVDTLEPVKVAVDQLSARNVNLLHADAVFKYLLTKLANTNGPSSNAMRTAVERRFLERRPKKLLDALNFLHNPDSINNTNVLQSFKMSPKKDIKDTIKNLYSSLYADNVEADENQNQDNIEPRPVEDEIGTAASTSVESDSSDGETDAKRLRRELDLVNMSAAVPKLKETTIMQDLKTWECNKIRSSKLELVYEALKTIQPTSVEPERAFSACSLILTKIRSRMGDPLLDAIHFLKSYYLKMKQARIGN